MNSLLFKSLTFLLLLSALARYQPHPSQSDWPEWRGPARDGTSPEKGLPTQWSPAGENLAWKAPYGGRSAPIVVGDHLFLQNAVGKGETLQERVMSLNADTGKVLWEHHFNVYMSDVPPHRVGWASPAADPATGNVYAFGVGGTLLGLSNDGKLLWERSLAEDFGIVTTHGGRTVSPVVEGDLVIVSALTAGWGNQARGSQRFMAFDKKTGETVWVSSPGGRPFDTTYAPPIVAAVNGMRLFIDGGGDGSVHALKVQTGEPVWKYEISKRGINTGVVLKGTTALVSHGEENLDSSEMGLLAAIDATATGNIGKDQIKWSVKGFIGEYSSPVIDGDRLYQIDNGSNLYAFDIASGKQLWKHNLGTIQKSSPVLGDGKLYVGTESGKFFILKPGPDRCEILDEDLLGSELAPEAVIGSVAVSRGRVYLVSSDALYCIGKKTTALPPPVESKDSPPSDSPATQIQVIPTELVLKPGTSVHFHCRLFDVKGRFLREGQAAWSLEQLRAGKFVVRAIEGNKVLVKLADNPFTKRARAYMGPSDWSNYTIEADARATEKRRQMGDAGVIAQRYALILFGNHQKLELESWQPETTRTARISYTWKPDTWYRLKLQVENLAGGKVRARGKVWPVSEAEPSTWSIERLDPIPNRQGSPGLYADATNEIFFDNLKVTSNQ